MYVFVLEWTPALTEALDKSDVDKTDSSRPPIPHGLYKIFLRDRDRTILFFRIRFCKLHGSNDDGIEFFQIILQLRNTRIIYEVGYSIEFMSFNKSIFRYIVIIAAVCLSVPIILPKVDQITILIQNHICLNRLK